MRLLTFIGEFDNGWWGPFKAFLIAEAEMTAKPQAKRSVYRRPRTNTDEHGQTRTNTSKRAHKNEEGVFRQCMYLRGKNLGQDWHDGFVAGTGGVGAPKVFWG
jgi:hypothetical protein